MILKSAIYKHFKGGYYFVIEPFAVLVDAYHVVYKNILEDLIYIRPVTEFVSKVSPLHRYIESSRVKAGIFSTAVDTLLNYSNGVYLKKIEQLITYTDEELSLLSSFLNLDNYFVSLYKEQGIIDRFSFVKDNVVDIEKFKKENIIDG